MTKKDEKIKEYLKDMTLKLRQSGCPIRFLNWLNYYNYFINVSTMQIEEINYVEYGNSLLEHNPFCENHIEECTLAEKKIELSQLLEDISQRTLRRPPRKKTRSRKV